MKELLLLVGFGFVLVFVYGVFYYILGRILMIFKSDKLRRIGHYFLAASWIAGPVTIVKKCPRSCNGKCKIWNCPLYRVDDCQFFVIKSEQRLFWNRITSEKEDPTDE